jgi:starch phosphorylase
MSMIEDQPLPAQRRMANLATWSQPSVNGVAELHSQLLRDHTLPTSPRCGRSASPRPTASPRAASSGVPTRPLAVITEKIGEGWVTDLDRLAGFRPFADDAAFRRRWREIKAKTRRLALPRGAQTATASSTRGHLFDMMVKRLHEYKRQLLKLLHVVTLYLRASRATSTSRIVRAPLRRQVGPGLRAWPS